MLASPGASTCLRVNAAAANIAAIKAGAQKHKANVIVGVGGGKSIDAAKQAAADLGLPVVCIPTIAATCAATTASVDYLQ